MSVPRRLAAALLLAVLGFACGGDGGDGPPELRLGLDECSRCRMIVSETATAAVARGPAGREARFDDLACLASFVAADGAGEWRAWVRTLDGEGWIEAGDALFTRHPSRITPMGSGLVALRAAPTDSAGDFTDWETLIRSAGEELTDASR